MVKKIKEKGKLITVDLAEDYYSQIINRINLFPKRIDYFDEVVNEIIFKEKFQQRVKELIIELKNKEKEIKQQEKKFLKFQNSKDYNTLLRYKNMLKNLDITLKYAIFVLFKIRAKLKSKEPEFRLNSYKYDMFYIYHILNQVLLYPTCKTDISEWNPYSRVCDGRGFKHFCNVLFHGTIFDNMGIREFDKQ